MLFITLRTGRILNTRTRKNSVFTKEYPTPNIGGETYIGVRGSLEQDISSLRAFGPGGGQISRVPHVSTRAAFGVFAEKYGFVQEGHTFIEKRWLLERRAHILEKVWFRARGAHIS